MNIISLLTKLIEKQDLSLLESECLMEEILMGKLTSAQIGAFLTALRMKGESVEEILGFIQVMRKYMLKIKTDGLVVDTCGTGGDGKGTFNISTAVAFVVVGAGVKVAKHGNRAVSSLCGSADVLEALGVNINITPVQAEEVLEKVLGTADRTNYFLNSLDLRSHPWAILDILLVTLLFYWAYLLLRETRAMRILYGIAILSLVMLAIP